jgi:hypothetical protein
MDRADASRACCKLVRAEFRVDLPRRKLVRTRSELVRAWCIVIRAEIRVVLARGIATRLRAIAIRAEVHVVFLRSISSSAQGISGLQDARAIQKRARGDIGTGGLLFARGGEALRSSVWPAERIRISKRRPIA